MSMTDHPIVNAVGKLNIAGNIIPTTWYKFFTFDNGKPDLIAIHILSDIVYWYRPTIKRCEHSGAVIGVHKKFKADLLQRDYASFADWLGVSKRQVKQAMDRLEEKGVIYRELRSISSNVHNVLFIGLRADILEQSLLHSNVPPPTSECIPPYIQMHTPLHSNVPPPTSECKTNTEITTKNTTEITTESVYSENPFFENENECSLTLTTPTHQNQEPQIFENPVGLQNQPQQTNVYQKQNFARETNPLVTEQDFVQEARPKQNKTVLGERAFPLAEENQGCEPPAPKPQKTQASKPQKPDCVDDEVWQDLLAHRKNLKKPLSATAWKQAYNQLLQAQKQTGHSFNDMIGEWLLVGWIGFKAEWYVNRTNEQTKAHTQAPVAGQKRDFQRELAEHAQQYGSGTWGKNFYGSGNDANQNPLAIAYAKE